VRRAQNSQAAFPLRLARPGCGLSWFRSCHWS
jgi:hypothetical protein